MMDGFCHLLTLPGELRNMIYAYALFEPAGLHFQRDERGIWRLYAAQPFTHTQNRPKIPKDLDDPDPERPDSVRRVSNQLQFVCHELRSETRGLGIRFNSLIFDGPQGILKFIELCPPKEHRFLRKMQIRKGLYSKNHPQPGDRGLDLPDGRHSRLFDFCTANPLMTIRNPLSGWRHDDAMFIQYAILLQMQFRKQSTRVSDFYTDHVTQLRVKLVTARKVQKLQRALPDNFKIFPEDQTFDEDVFTKACEADGLISGMLATVVEGGIKRWIPEVRKIYAEGV